MKEIWKQRSHSHRTQGKKKEKNKEKKSRERTDERQIRAIQEGGWRGFPNIQTLLIERKKERKKEGKKERKKGRKKERDKKEYIKNKNTRGMSGIGVRRREKKRGGVKV